MNGSNNEEELSEEDIEKGTIYQSHNTFYDKYDNNIEIPSGFKLAQDSEKDSI